MAVTDLFLEWPVDEDGYSIKSRVERRPKRPTVLEGWEDGEQEREIQWVAPNGGRLISKNALAAEGLYRKFVELALTETGILEFTNEHGLLWGRTEQPMADYEFARNDLLKLLAKHEAQEWESLGEGLSLIAESSTLRGIGNLGIVYFWRRGMTRPQPRLRPPNLFEAMRVQLLLDLAGGVNLRHCRLPSCHKWFTYGPGTQHRVTAFYCTRKHRQAHDWLLKTEASKKRGRKK